MAMKRLIVIGGNGAMLSPAATHLSAATSPAKVVASHTRPSALPERVEMWRKHGALIAGSIDEALAVESVDAALVCVGKNADDVPVVARCAQRWKGSGRAILHLSTVSPDFARAAAAFCQSLGVKYSNYPLTGGPAGAIAAKMLILCSGSTNLYEEYKPILETLGQPRYFGENEGRAAEVKLQGHMMVFGGLLGLSSAAATSFACASLPMAKSEEVASFLDYLNSGSGGTNQWGLCLRRGLAADDWREGFQAEHAAVDALYAAHMAIQYKLSHVTTSLLIITAASLAFLVRRAPAGQRVATHCIAKELREPAELDLFLKPLWAKMAEPEVALQAAQDLFPVSMQPMVLLNVGKSDFENVALNPKP